MVGDKSPLSVRPLFRGLNSNLTETYAGNMARLQICRTSEQILQKSTNNLHCKMGSRTWALQHFLQRFGTPAQV